MQCYGRTAACPPAAGWAWPGTTRLKPSARKPSNCQHRLLLQVVVQGALVRRGLLLLQPDTVEVLGGSVARLEAARQRVLATWSQPAGALATLALA